MFALFSILFTAGMDMAKMMEQLKAMQAQSGAAGGDPIQQADADSDDDDGW